MSTEDRKFCCKEMKEGWLSSCILEIDKEDLEDKTDHQNVTYHWIKDGDIESKYKDVKVGELYLYNDEMSQIEGKPFKFCPWCGKELDVLGGLRSLFEC